MLKASALVYSLFISLLLVTLGSAFLSLNYFNAIYHETWQGRERVVRNVQSGILMLQSDPMLAQGGDEKRLDLFGESIDTVALSRRTWGAFELCMARGEWKDFSWSQIVLSGFALADTLTALYLADLDRPLSLCGRTEIKGRCFLPKAGVKRAYIEGQNFVGADLIQGKVLPSSKMLPALNETLLENISALMRAAQTSDSVVMIQPEDEMLPVNHSFFKKTLVYSSVTAINIEDVKMKGNVIIRSEREISIESSSSLEDIVVIAPRVFIRKGFKGNIQVFATDTLVVEEDVQLNYPSVLSIIPSENQKAGLAPCLEIKGGSQVMGSVLGYFATVLPSQSMVVRINKDSKVHGEVYSNGLLDLQGSVYGTVYATKFVLKTPSAAYENHLLGSVIDPTVLSRYYVGSGWVSNNKAHSMKTIKQLY